MPFKKGDPRINRKGRPRKGGALTDLIKKELERREGDNIRTNKEIIADILVKEATKGNLQAIDRIYDRIEGKAVSIMDIESRNENVVIEIPSEFAGEDEPED